MKLPELKLVAKRAESEEQTARDVLTAAKEHAIVGETTYRSAAEMIAEVKVRAGEIDALRRTWTDPLTAVVASINKFFSPVTAALEETEHVLKGKIVSYSEDTALRRDDLIRRAGLRSKIKPAEAKELLAEAAECEIPRVDGVSIRTGWTGEVDDAASIPREYLIPDVKALAALTRAKGCDPQVPGWRAFPKSTVAITASRIAGSE